MRQTAECGGATRAINAAGGCRPVVMLVNLSGFDGSPESLRRLQLEYGAELVAAVQRGMNKVDARS